MSLFLAKVISTYPVERDIIPNQHTSVFLELLKSKFLNNADSTIINKTVLTDIIYIDTSIPFNIIQYLSLTEKDLPNTVLVPIRITLDIYLLVLFINNYSSDIATLNHLETLTFKTDQSLTVNRDYFKAFSKTHALTPTTIKFINNAFESFRYSNNKLFTCELSFNYSNILNTRILRILTQISLSPRLLNKYGEYMQIPINELRSRFPDLSIPIG